MLVTLEMKWKVLNDKLKYIDYMAMISLRNENLKIVKREQCNDW